MVLNFFSDFKRSDFNPLFTPDGRPWLEQDPAFWELIDYLEHLDEWAEDRIKHPRRGIF